MRRIRREGTRTKRTLRGDGSTVQGGLCLLWEGRVAINNKRWIGIWMFLGYEAGCVE